MPKPESEAPSSISSAWNAADAAAYLTSTGVDPTRDREVAPAQVEQALAIAAATRGLFRIAGWETGTGAPITLRVVDTTGDLMLKSTAEPAFTDRYRVASTPQPRITRDGDCTFMLKRVNGK